MPRTAQYYGAATRGSAATPNVWQSRGTRVKPHSDRGISGPVATSHLEIKYCVAMPEWLTGLGSSGQVSPGDVLIRLVAALVAGGLVAVIYVRTRPDGTAGGSFPGTLVLLAILIAMVTQVIGDNVARAFSLVGALSIVRFRTVVRDTQDTAYVIFAVVVGMAVGAGHPWVAVIGLGVVALAAALLMTRQAVPDDAGNTFVVTVRVGLGQDLEGLLGPVLGKHTLTHRLSSVATAKQGLAIDAGYEVELRPDRRADELLAALNQIEGVQSVELQRRRLGDG